MINLSRFTLCLALLGIGAPTILAQSAVTGQKNAPAGTTAISGHVTVNGKPAAGVTVLLFAEANPGSFVNFNRSGFMAKSVTDVQGNYRIEGLSAGGYKVLPFNPALVSAGENGSFLGPGKYISAGEGESVDGIDFALAPAAVISGRVTLAGSQPGVGVWVTIRPADHSGILFDPGTGAPRQFEKTDDKGVFRIYGLAPDRYKVSVVNYQPAPSASAAPVYYPGVTDQSRAGTISVAAGEEVSDADIAVGAPERTYDAVGQILDEGGKPIANASYALYAVSETGARVGGGSSSSHADASGKFRIRGLSPGRYAIAVMPDQESGYCSDPTVVNVEAADVTGLRLQAHMGAAVSGVVAIEGTDDPQVLAQLSDVRLYVISVGEEMPYPTERTTNLPADGSFKVAGLIAGRLSIGLENQNGVNDFSILRIERDGVLQKENLSISDAEQVTGVRVLLAHGTGVIHGQVSVQGGVLPDGAHVMVSAKLISGEASRIVRSTLADARGRFEIHSLVDGQYDIATSYEYGSKRIGSAQHQTVTVAGGQAPEITAMLELSKKQ
jgi:hypothetical protein